MKIAAAITCVNYGDILAATLPTNRSHFHYIVVATTPDDVQTQKVCEFWNVHCVRVPEFNVPGGFRKGAGINAAINALKSVGMADDWLIHMDADIMLPPLAGEMLGRADLDRHNIYGIDRFMVKSYEDWAEFLTKPTLQHENGVYVHTANAFSIGTRIAPRNASYAGYTPLGFFQMWCPAVSGVWEYPTEHTSAGRGDMVFAGKWQRNRRGMIPEIIGYHLESEAAEMGVNWNGRKTRQFLPSRAHTPLMPYMTDEEVSNVESLLKALPVAKLAVLEWGSGGSTVYFPDRLIAAGRFASWTAIEHDPTWAARVAREAHAARIIHVPVSGDDPPAWASYIEPPTVTGRRFDAIIIDGRCRRRCLAAAAGMLRDDNAIVILHDAERAYYHPAISGGHFVCPRLWVGHRGNLVTGGDTATASSSGRDYDETQ